MRNRLGIASRPEDAVHAAGIDRAEEILEVEAQHDVRARVTEREGDSRSPAHKPVRAFMRRDAIENRAQQVALDLAQPLLGRLDEPRAATLFVHPSVAVVPQGFV